MGVGPRTRLPFPAHGPNRRGLLSPGGAIIVEEPNDRWAGGFAYEPLSCDVVGPRPIICSEDDDKPAPDHAGVREYDPVYLLGADECSTMDVARERIERARANLRATESHQMESELWDGTATRAATPDLVNDYLAIGGAGGATDLADSPVPFANALAELEQGLAECLHGAQGMVHAVPLTVNLWWGYGLLRLEGQRLLTPMDNIVIAGSGYSGAPPATNAGDAPTAPSDIADGASAYGTGLVYVRLGADVEVGEERSQVIRTTNDWTVFVERPAAATWAGCCTVTIPVDHTTDLYCNATV